MKIYFPIHLDGGNRGCEAIAKGTAILLEKPKEELVGLCRNPKLDKRLGIDEFVSLWQYPLWLKVYNKFYCKFKSFIVKILTANVCIPSRFKLFSFISWNISSFPNCNSTPSAVSNTRL